MAGSIREALESAVNEAETKDENVVETQAASPVETSDAAPATDIESASSVGGGEEKSPTEPVQKDAAAEKNPDDAAAAEKPAPTAEETAEQKRLHRIDRAPQSWKKEAKGEWANLPLHIRQEVHKREAEITRALAQSAPDRQLAEQFKQAITPYMAMIQSRGVNPIQATEFLMKADYTLSTAPKADRAKFMADLIRQYDVDIAALDDALAGAVPQQQSQGGADIAAIVQQQLQQALAPIMQERQVAAQRSQQEVTQTVESMAYDPKYPYFEDVRQDMADLMEISFNRGVALSLDEAYTRATRMNPDVSGQVERQATMSNANQQHQQALRAKAAASSVTGAPASGGDQRLVGDGSLRGAIEAAFGGQRL
jgi:hypothetical protein